MLSQLRIAVETNANLGIRFTAMSDITSISKQCLSGKRIAIMNCRLQRPCPDHGRMGLYPRAVMFGVEQGHTTTAVTRCLVQAQ